jgi:cbb3-type cytochrome oxidase subunit 3
MGWLLLESAIAFLVLVAIVAWTLKPSRNRRRDRAVDE